MMPPVQAETEETRFGSLWDLGPYRLLGRFLGYARPYRHGVTVAILLLPVAAVLQLLQPLLIQRVVDDHLMTGQRQGLAALLALFLMLVIGQFVVGYLQATLNAWLGQRVVRDIRKELFAHMMGMESSFFERSASGRLTNRIGHDTEAVSHMVSAGMIHLIGDILLLLGLAGGMVVLSPHLSMMTLFAMPLIVIGTTLVTRKMRWSQREERLIQARMAGQMTEALEGRATLRLFHCHPYQQHDFDRLNRSYQSTTFTSNFLEAFQFSFIETTSMVLVAALFWYGGHLQTGDEITIGVIIAFIDYIRRLFSPIRDLSNKFTTMQAAITALERIFALLDRPPAITEANAPTPPPRPVRGDIAFRDVTFDYGSGPVLRGIDCHIRPGEHVAVVGPTGAGKSTMIKLLNRTYEPQAGRIELDGLDIATLPLSTLRRTIGVVQQETFLFAGTIADNISLGSPAIGRAEIRQAAQETGALTFIHTFPAGLDTTLTERGANLSSGQRQLLGITRVLAFNPHILVMDEATSSVDTISERLIQGAMQRLLAGRTAVIIAHRLSTILHADRILVIHKGRIVESGCHETLLQRDGLYARLYALQFRQ